jgi:hypothetical protein
VKWASRSTRSFLGKSAYGRYRALADLPIVAGPARAGGWFTRAG